MKQNKKDKGVFMMRLTQEEALNEMYNLILNPGTREWERTKLMETKEKLETGSKLSDQLAKLEAVFRPLASRNNLTPDVMDFYLRITNNPLGKVTYDFSKHEIVDPINQERAVFAGGCFWCMVEPFETHPGIISVLSGYIGGKTDHPTYDQVSGGYTGHVEAVEIIFDKRRISYEELVVLYWTISDPTDAFGQFQDRGNQYRPIIFVQNDQQRQIAERSKNELITSGKFDKPIVTEIKSATTFWPAENYHQEFYKKQPKRYRKMKHARQTFLYYQKIKQKFNSRKRG
jgi:peptide-methionine (S)-S-oxide reductase